MANSNRVVAEEVRKPMPVVGARQFELVWTFLSGASVGFIVWVVAFLLQKFVFGNLLCAGVSSCSEATNYAGIVATIIGAIAGLVMLTTAHVYRPLLIIVTAAISLWGFGVLTSEMPWYWALIASCVVFGLAYAAFAWLARIRSFVIALIVTIVLVVLVRLVFAS